VIVQCWRVAEHDYFGIEPKWEDELIDATAAMPFDGHGRITAGGSAC
jgi:hypothetical protein